MDFPSFWFLGNDIHIAHQFGELLLQDEKLGIRNTADLAISALNLYRATTDFDAAWPGDCVVPVVGLPDHAFAPDFWTFGSYTFASRRLRDAMAQPGDVIQFLPFNLISASVEAQAQDYRWMRVLARQEALDLARCECEIEEEFPEGASKPTIYFSDIDFVALRQDLVARSEIFRIEERPTNILVTDALAERILRAGCTGMEFRDPANRWSGKRVERLRTADGIAERRVGFLD